MESLEGAERAIQAFEQIHKLQVTIHDLRGSLMPSINGERHQHRHPLCRCVKAAHGEWPCLSFEIVRLRAELPACPEGRYHICHAGLVEWITPVYDGLDLEWVLFAGVRMPGKKLGPVRRGTPTRWQRPPWDARIALPPPVDEMEANLILEHLRQLAARLQNWVRQRNKQVQPATEVLGENLLTRRRTSIRRYIDSYHTHNIRLRDLASALKVSVDRATHLVRECCGQTYRDILIEARLTTARELLRYSSLPILEVALASGFNEISHFNRLFRKRVGKSPGQYRQDLTHEHGPPAA
jgi:AraC-like DNA-binding protein